jgi:hypothetical protein
MNYFSNKYTEQATNELYQNKCYIGGFGFQMLSTKFAPLAFIGAIVASTADLIVGNSLTKEIKECSTEMTISSFTTYMGKDILPACYNAIKAHPMKLAFLYPAFHTSAEILERTNPDYYKIAKDGLKSLFKESVSFSHDVFDRMMHPFSFDKIDVEAVGKDSNKCDVAN